MPFGDHLGADQDIDFAFPDPLQKGVELAAVAAGVAVEAADGGGGKPVAQLFFQPFGAKTHSGKTGAVAGGTERGRRQEVAAVVADQSAGALVKREGDLAVPAAHHGAAVAAHHEVGKAPPVEKEQDLLVSFQGRGNGVLQAVAEQGRIAIGGSQLLPHIHDLHLWQGAVFDAVTHDEEAILAPFRVAETRQGRSGGAEKHHCPFPAAPHQGCIAGVVAQPVFLFVGWIVLFVHDDEPQVGQRRKESGTGADNDPPLAGGH